uniref:Immunoglobulin V-set domain-containing protein n=1 Tax=Maylandia zebra TaxID=106582 RepID=A0A3P9CKR7_9CICH
MNLIGSLYISHTGAVAQTVVYPFTSTCAVRGSTVTLPCTFTPRKSFSDGQREVPLKIVRVRWCKNHVLCLGSTPSVYDSNPANIDPRYQYLGDKKTNCTLQIRDVQQGDNPPSLTPRVYMCVDSSALNLPQLPHLNRAFPAVSYMIKHMKTILHQIIFHTHISQIHSNTQHFLSLWVCLTADSYCLFF